MRKATLLQRWIFLLNRSRSLEVLLVLLFFSAFSILLTWPQVLPSGTVPGFGGDVFQVFWRLYQAEGVRNLQDVFTEWALRPSTATGTLIPIIGVEGAYKLAWFLSHILSGVGMYFLALHLTRRRSASLLAAMIYAFSSFHFGRSLGFWGIMQQQWLPFLTLSLILFFEQWKYRWIIASLVFGWLTIEAENHLTLAATLFVLLLCVDRMIRYRSELRKHGKEIISSIVFLGIFGVLILWKHWETLKIVFPDESAFEISFAWTLRGSNDLLAFVVPAFFHPLVGSFTKGLYENVLHQSAVNTSYIGIVGLILSVIAIVYRRKFSDVGFWAITGLIFLILSLGPILEIAGPLPIQIPLPYYLLREGIPLFQSIRAVDRLFVISMLAIAVLSGYGMFYLLSHVRKRTNRLLMMSMIGTVLLIESVAWNLPTESTGYSSYYENLREENVRRILEIPGSSNYTYASHVWYTSVIHGKIVYNNFDFARKLEGTLDREKSMPGIRDVLFADEETDFSHYDVNDLSFSELARWAFSYEQIDRVIVGKEAFTYAKFPYPKEKYAQSRRVLEEDLGLLPIYEDERLIAYDTSIFTGSEHRAEPLVLPMHPGWDKPVFRGEEQRVIRRNAQNSTSILVVNTGAALQNGRIRLRMESDVPQSIEIRTPDSTHIVLLPDSVTDVFVPFSQLSSGETSVTITLSGGERTVALQQVDWQSEEEIASQTNLDLKLDSGQVVRFPFVDNDVTCTRCISVRDLQTYPQEAPSSNFTQIPLLAELTTLASPHPTSTGRKHGVQHPDYYVHALSDFIRTKDISWIALDRVAVSDDALQAFSLFMENYHLGVRTFDDENVVVFSVNPPTEFPLLFVTGMGWGDRAENLGYPLFGTQVQSTLIAKQEITPTLEFRLRRTEESPIQSMRIHIGSWISDAIPISHSLKKKQIDLPLLEQGSHSMKFTFFNGAGEQVSPQESDHEVFIRQLLFSERFSQP